MHSKQKWDCGGCGCRSGFFWLSQTLWRPPFCCPIPTAPTQVLNYGVYRLQGQSRSLRQELCDAHSDYAPTQRGRRNFWSHGHLCLPMRVCTFAIGLMGIDWQRAKIVCFNVLNILYNQWALQLLCNRTFIFLCDDSDPVRHQSAMMSRATGTRSQLRWTRTNASSYYSFLVIPWTPYHVSDNKYATLWGHK